MANIAALVSDYLDCLTADERLRAMSEIQLFGRVWLPQLAEVFPDRDYSTSVIELASFAVLPDDFCEYVCRVGRCRCGSARVPDGRSIVVTYYTFSINRSSPYRITWLDNLTKFPSREEAMAVLRIALDRDYPGEWEINDAEQFVLKGSPLGTHILARVDEHGANAAPARSHAPGGEEREP